MMRTCLLVFYVLSSSFPALKELRKSHLLISSIFWMLWSIFSFRGIHTGALKSSSESLSAMVGSPDEIDDSESHCFLFSWSGLSCTSTSSFGISLSMEVCFLANLKDETNTYQLSLELFFGATEPPEPSVLGPSLNPLNMSVRSLITPFTFLLLIFNYYVSNHSHRRDSLLWESLTCVITLLISKVLHSRFRWEDWEYLRYCWEIWWSGCTCSRVLQFLALGKW